MKLISSNGYVITEIEGNLYVVDTGSPLSFNYNGLDRITINGDNYALGNSIICQKEQGDSITGVDLSGFIGLDILQRTDLTIDYENRELFFGIKENVKPSPDFYYMPFKLFFGSYILTDNIILNGRHLENVLIDTGAPISYVSKNIAESLETTGEYYRDRGVMLGDLNGEYRKGVMKFSSMAALNYSIPVKVGVMDGNLGMLGMLGIDALIGSNMLSEKRVLFDFSEQRIGIALDERSKDLRN